MNKGSTVQHTHPLLYWITVTYIVGLPNFLQFDVSGRTHEFGLFNISSISRIALTLLTAYVLTINLAMGRGPIFPRKVDVSSSVWLLLLVWCIITTILQPPSRLSPHLATDLPLSLFRLGEWVLAFVIFLALYTREPAENATALIVELIGRASWIMILRVWIALPFLPHLVYGVNESGNAAALGGLFMMPGILAFEACVAFYYSLFFFRLGLSRWLSCIFALITLEMTRSRTFLISFAVTYACYAIFFSRKTLYRWIAVGSIIITGPICLAFSNNIVSYFAKGQNIADVASLDGRTYVWQACIDAIQLRPVMGYGFVVGAKYAIKDHWIYTHWLPPTGHSEFVQALLVGGIPACAMLIFIYASIQWRYFKMIRRGPLHIFLAFALFQMVIHSMFAGEVLMTPYGSEGAVFLLCWIALADSKQVPESDSIHSSFPSASRFKIA
jgi:O-antigen ligase